MTLAPMRLRLPAIGAFALLSLSMPACASLAQAAGAWLEPVRVIYPGEVIRDEMLIEGPATDIEGAAAATATARESIVGKVARRTLLPHHAIALSAIVEKALIISGRIIEASYVEGALTIAAKVMALQDGRLGDLIQVRSMDSGKLMSGIVQAAGGVRMLAQ